MEDHLYGRLTTLKTLDKVRSDTSKGKMTRMRADRAMNKIVMQLRDRPLLALRERLIKATRAGDKHEAWKIENQMRDYEDAERELVE